MAYVFLIGGRWISFKYLIALPRTVEFNLNDHSKHLGSLL